MPSLRKSLKYGIPVLAALILLWMTLPSCSSGQSLDTKYGATITVWNQHTECFQNTAKASLEVEGRASVFFTEVYTDFKWWGNCDSKVASSPLNAESGMAYTRLHGANAGFRVEGVQIGATLRRRADHFVWRHKDRHNHFPGSWRIGKQACNGGTAPSWPDGGPQCASLGYREHLRPYLGYEAHGVDVSVIGPGWTWKTLTLPWPDWMIRGSYEFRGWRVSAYGQAGGTDEQAGWIRVSRVLSGPLRLGVKGGRAATPGWRENGADYLGISLVVTNQ